jgi:hypothetical protein
MQPDLVGDEPYIDSLGFKQSFRGEKLSVSEDHEADEDARDADGGDDAAETSDECKELRGEFSGRAIGDGIGRSSGERGLWAKNEDPLELWVRRAPASAVGVLLIDFLMSHSMVDTIGVSWIGNRWTSRSNGTLEVGVCVDGLGESVVPTESSGQKADHLATSPCPGGEDRREDDGAVLQPLRKVDQKTAPLL